MPRKQKEIVEVIQIQELIPALHAVAKTSLKESDMCDGCNEDVHIVRVCEACIWHACAPSLPGSKLSVLLLRIVLKDTTTKVFEVYLELRMRVYVDEKKIHARHQSRKPVAELPHKISYAEA